MTLAVLRKIALIVLGLLLIILSALLGVLATGSGTQWLLSKAQEQLPGLTVHYEKGSLLGSLALSQVRFIQGEQQVELAHVYLDWSPLGLLKGELQIDSLRLQQLALVLPPQPEPEPAAPLFPLQLPALALPLAVEVSELSLTGLNLNGEVLVDEAVFKARLDRKGLQVSTLKLASPFAQLNAQGTLIPEGNYPLDITLDWQVPVPDQPALKGLGRISGNLSQLSLQQSLSGTLSALLDGKVNLLEVDPQIALAITDVSVPMQRLLPDDARILQGRVALSGRLSEFSLDSQLALENTLEQLTLSGNVAQVMSAPAFDLALQWRNLFWPQQQEAQVASAQGKATLTGTLDAYQLSAELGLNGPQIPAGQWQLSAKGNTQQAQQLQLTGQLLDGQLKADGQLAWSPALAWNVSLQGQNINPSQHWSEWPGQLALQLHSEGRLDADGQPDMSVKLAELHGTLRAQTLKGAGDVQLQQGKLRLSPVSITLGGAQAHVDGVISDQLALNWRLNTPDLSAVLPQAKGVLSGQGTVAGSRELPVLKGELSGQQLRLAEQGIASLAAQLDMDLSGAKHSRVQLTAANLRSGELRWSDLALTLEGTPEQHQLKAALNGEPLTVQLSADGRWQDNQWRGTLAQADITQPIAGRWQLTQAVPVLAGTGVLDVKKACWQQQKSSGNICLNATQKAQTLAADVQARGLPAALAEPFLPAGTQLQGALALQGTFKQVAPARPVFSLQGRLENGRIALEGEGLELLAGVGELTVNGQKNTLNARLNLPLITPVGQLASELQVSDLYQRGLLQGHVNMNIQDLGFISLLTPDLQAVKGALNSDLTLAGTLSAPDIRGSMILSGGQAEVPAIGLVMDSIALTIKDQPGQRALAIDGLIGSGEGELRVLGQYDLAQQQTQLKIKGDDFKAVATPEIEVWITPDMQITMVPELLSVRGEVKVPKANISPPARTASTPLSKDVVILDQTDTTSSARQAMDIQMRVTLGDAVRVNAFGFEGQLQGSVMLEEDGRRATRASGGMEVAAGKYRLYGQDLNIEKGRLVFSGGPVDNPGLDLRVTRAVDNVTVGAQVGGLLRNPQLNLFSEPSMPESSLLSYLLLGRAPGQGQSASEQALLFKAAAALAMKGGNTVGERLTDTFNLDSLGFEGDSVEDAGLFIGKYLSPKLYVKYGVGLLSPSSTFFMRYILSKRWSLESQTGTRGSGGDLIYTLEH